jgi:hypothetical protein
VIAAALVASSLVGFASTANAAGGEQGVLLMKGPGSLYAGPNTLESLTVSAGSAASFGIEVKNTGSSTAQFNLQLSSAMTTCATACAPTAVITTGSLIVTPLAAGPNGYYTAPIAAGAVATYTLKITTNKTMAPGDLLRYEVQLADTAGNPLGSTSAAYVGATRGTGGSAADQFVSAPGNPATSPRDTSSLGLATSPSVALGKSFTFTVKLMNDGAGPAAIGYRLYLNQLCDAYFPIKVTQPSKLGSIDVSAAVQNGTYQTSTLARGASVTLTVTGVSLAGGENCLLDGGSSYGTAIWNSYSWVGSTASTFNYLLFSPAAS